MDDYQLTTISIVSTAHCRNRHAELDSVSSCYQVITGQTRNDVVCAAMQSFGY